MTDKSSTDTRDCPFCAIVAGRDPSVEIVCSGSTWLAFFPDSPATPGHTLVIPREHVADLWQAPPSMGAELFRAVSKVGKAISRAVKPEGLNLITSSGEAAEQTVFHLHLHIVPRWSNDRLDIWPSKRPINNELRQDLAMAVRTACSGEDEES